MRREFFKASAARIFAVATTLVSGLANLKLSSLFLTPDIYGVVVVALQLIGYLPLLDGGFRMATNRLLLTSEGENKRNLVIFSQTIYSYLLVLGILVGAILMAGYGIFSRSHDHFESFLLLLVMGGCGAITMFASAQSGLLLGLGAQATMCAVAGLSSLLNVAVFAGVLAVGYGVWAFPASLLASGVTTYLLALLFLRKRHGRFPLIRFALDTRFRELFPKVRSDAWQAFRSQISIVLLFSSDLVIASLFCKPAEVAIYGVLSRVLGIARSFLQSFNESAWPFAAARARGFEQFQDRIVTANAWLYGTAGGGLVIILPWFIEAYMGSTWKPPALLCWLFVVRFLVVGIAGPASYFLLGKGDFRNVARCTEYELLCCLALSVGLGWHFGATGIAVAYLAGTAAGTLIPFWFIYAQLRGQPLIPLLTAAWLRVAIGFGAGWGIGNVFLKLLTSRPEHFFR